MAHYYFKSLSKKFNLPFVSISAGTMAYEGLTPTPLTLKLLKEKDIDATDHQSHRLTSIDVRKTYLNFVMTEDQLDYMTHRFPETVGKTFLLSDYYSGQFKSFLHNTALPISSKLNHHQADIQLPVVN